MCTYVLVSMCVGMNTMVCVCCVISSFDVIVLICVCVTVSVDDCVGV